ncbi:undecaprenyl-phosphate alpha-N-acetylglucosaminyl 1-phosphate transferase [Anaerobacillus alkalidiazotrophicus]|uniref:Undecaprenyl-phosphate alpha-N-acetylglucosaminyl 1-phosphate transferase n=1 Tax=Anaerobacillus alkalidiazotrophicus TaxID=472963 RepID=A0A1S2MAG1_9BACI|nr:MraY family glycosyltransferase [Anaerobacillus alkalidiazotrophicus]OIJ21762.1 undecaprenyl-phosphate alpha-N-acetylglucosaminyl 1-phosphate transferase [Anaerobacillus alkalidiazotrophicus]
MSLYIVGFLISLVASLCSVPFVKEIAVKFGIVDQPSNRKIHMKQMPRLGGLAIILGFFAGFLYISPTNPYLMPIILGACIIIVIGILDDKFTLSYKIKLAGQVAAAAIVVFSGLTVEFIYLPMLHRVELGMLEYIFTMLWIIGITNAVNLIDGLDGLASGVSTIALAAILFMAIINGQMFVATVTLLLMASTLGFLVFNFYPAKIFMGDTGSLFLGYFISIISILGFFKSFTLVSFIIPILILSIPIFDTYFAIIRRLLNKQKITAPDRSHLHHCLLQLGFSHRTTVLIIYGMGAFFGISAIIFSNTTLWVSFLIIGLILLLVHITAEFIGLIGQKRPLITMIKRLTSRS